MDINSPPIRAFLSYAHADDEEFGFVEPLANKLKAFVRGKSGRELEIFVDRASIGWGTDWRASISSSVEGATIFIPLLSANYLESDVCREEFLAFHSKAEVLGVTELLLPILIFKSSLFEEGATDEIAQIAEAIQYKCIEDAFLAGFQSPDWLKCTRDLAESLLQVLAKAEQALLEVAAADATSGAAAVTKVDQGVDDPDAEESGLAELVGELEPTIAGMTAAAERLSPAIVALGEVPEQVGDLPNDPTAKQFTTWAIRLAQGFRSPSEDLEVAGKDLFDATKNLDETLLRMKRLTKSIDAPELSEMLNESRKELVQSFGNLQEVTSSMEDMLSSMKSGEVMSVPLRKSLQPARRGLTAVRDSLKVIESWQEEYED